MRHFLGKRTDGFLSVLAAANERRLSCGKWGRELSSARVRHNRLKRLKTAKQIIVAGGAHSEAPRSRHPPNHVADIVRNQQRAVGTKRHPYRPSVRRSL